ncbi:NAD-dependent deacetylase [Chloroflexota bacterium]
MEELIEIAARDLVSSKYAIALTGAGMSTESGISDFRGPSGIWTRDPEAERRAYQTYYRFLDDPKKYWEEKLGGQSLFGDLGKIDPNAGHYALAELEKMGIIRLVITQNIDNLHRKAGSRNVLEYHGNAFKLRCMDCNVRFNLDDYDLDKLREEGKLPPRCKRCEGVLKEDVVHFREPIPGDVAHQSLMEAWKCDLMLICGTSAVVYPFAELPRVARQRKTETESKSNTGIYIVDSVPAVTIIELNAEPTPLTADNVSDYLIQGKTGEILPRLVAEVTRLRKQV